MSIRVRVPATSANLGPGFDTLGLALGLYCHIEIAANPGGADSAVMAGQGAGALPVDGSNIAVAAARTLLDTVGAPPVAFQLTAENDIPLARGLGSSAAARVGAIVAANAWAAAQGWGSQTEAELVALASRLEGHPDNTSAALLGGLVVSCVAGGDNGGQAVALRLPVERLPRFVVFIPDSELATKTARAVLPDAVFRSDAVYNVGHTALLLAALSTGRWDLLGEALGDKLHQDHRAALMPGYNAMVHAARAAGAFGATLSGAGPTVMAWLPHDEVVVAEATRAIEDAAAEHEVFGRALPLEVDYEGCRVLA